MPRGYTYSEEIKQTVRNLRKQGWSLGEISSKMNIPKNSLSGWVKGIRLTETQIKRIKEKEIVCAAKARRLSKITWNNRVETWKENIRNQIKYLAKLPQKDPEIAKIICGILYLCEGSKYPTSKCLVFANSDPEIIRYFLYLLKTAFGIDERKLHCRIGYRWDQDINELRKYWSEITGIPLSQFYRSKPDERTKGQPTLRQNYKGICAIQYTNTELQFKLQAIGEAIITGGAEGSRTPNSTMPL